MQALLVHGMGRTPLSMMRLARALRGADIETQQFGYFAARQSVPDIVSRLGKRLTAIAGREYVVVGHSLGGVLLRIAVAALPPDVARPSAMILLAVPNRSPRLAHRFHHTLWYRLLNGDAGQLLASEQRMAAVPPPVTTFALAVGTGGPRGRWSPFRNELNDGIVAVSEVAMDGAAESIHIRRLHPVMMNDPAARALVRRFCVSSRAAVP